MIRISFSRKECKVECDGCGTTIESNAPSYQIDFGALVFHEQAEQTVNLCEDCGNDLQNDMTDEYQRFVDLNQ